MPAVLRLGSWIRPAGVSPVRVGVGAPGSRPQSRGEIPAAERGVESLFGGSKRAGCDYSLVTFTTEEPSRSCHGEGHVRRVGFRSARWVLPGYGKLHARTVWFGTRETRLSSLVSEDRWYKPMAKSSGGQRESEGVVVVLIGVQNNASGAKGPHFDRACVGSERKDMAARRLRSNHPGGHKPVVPVASEMAQGATCPVARAQPRGRLWEAAKRSRSRTRRANWSRWGDSPWAARRWAMSVGCVAAPGRSSASRVRENRTHGLKGESGNRPA
jgi:hypothetical protein